MSGERTDEEVWEAIGGDPEDFKQNGQRPDIPDEPPMWFKPFLEEFRQLQNRVADLDRQVNGDPTHHGTRTTLQQYADMPRAVRENTLGKTDRIAVTIHEHWGDLAQQLGDQTTHANFGVTTRRNSLKKNNPSQFRVDLEAVAPDDLLDENGRLSWAVIHDAMMAVASLSGGTPEQTQYGRTTIVGGLYEFHERTTPDNTDDSTYKVLVTA